MGMEAEPIHRVLVNAKGEYDFRSDKLALNGRELDVDHIQFTAVSTKKDGLKNFAHRDHISIQMIDNVFAPFVELLRRNTQTGEIVMTLYAQQHQEFADMIRLSFDGVVVTRSAGAAIKDQTLRDRRLSQLADHMRRSERLLFAIAVIVGLILLHLLFR
jgi:hypothetical protein